MTFWDLCTDLDELILSFTAPHELFRLTTTNRYHANIIFAYAIYTQRRTMFRTFYKLNIRMKKIDRSIVFREACRDGHIEFAKYIFGRFNSDYYVQDTRHIWRGIEFKVFNDVCLLGHIDTAKWLMELSVAGMIEPIDQDLCYIFYEVCCNGHTDVVDWLWSLDTNRMYQLQTVFRNSYRYNHLDLMEWTIGKDVEHNIRIDAALIHACKHGNVLMAKRLVELSETYGPLVLSNSDMSCEKVCASGNVEMAQWVADNNLLHDLHGNDDEALRTACKKRHVSMVKWLIGLSQKLDSPFSSRSLFDVFNNSCGSKFKELADILLELNQTGKSYLSFTPKLMANYRRTFDVKS